MTQTLPPFRAGQTAFRAGVALDQNPHEAGAPFEPDDYPGNHQNWTDGHNHARHVHNFTEANKE